MPKDLLIRLLARCFLAGEPGLDAMVERCAKMLGREWRWLRPVARNYLSAMEWRVRPRLRDVEGFIDRDPVFERAWQRHSKRFTAQELLIEPQQMQPVAEWPVSRIESARELADWFWLDDGQLEWFADLHSLGEKTRNGKLRHYHYRILEKASGGLRLIEAPKPRLKEMQRQILDHILNAVPAHAAVHGFVKGRNIKTFAAPHVGRQVVLRMDLRNFFPSFHFARVQALFRVLGFPETVADLLGGICTTITPAAVWKRLEDETYARRHLPQGSPSSPALANLGAYRMDCRLSGLSKAAGADYTRYADDLAFSGDAEFERHAERFSAHAAAVVMEEGFAVQHHKTRIMRQGVRQHLAGLVTNQKLNIARRDFDALKATLTNCVRLGPESQNHARHADFRAHLDGRIGFVEMVNAQKGARLRQIFARVQWPLL
jgi:hypothetical protein